MKTKQLETAHILTARILNKYHHQPLELAKSAVRKMPNQGMGVKSAMLVLALVAPVACLFTDDRPSRKV